LCAGPQPEIKRHSITVNGYPRRVEPESRVSRASEILPSIAGRPESGM
jgi:hypothetical protein